jgi:DNA repair exonuclease SbcCD ATPase subunit
MQIEDIFENTIAETNLTQLSRQHIQEMRDELEALYQKDVSKFDFDPAEYAKMTDDLVERIDRKMRTLRSDSKLLATAKDSLENQDKELEDDDKKEIEDIIKFTQDKMETGNTALTELRKALNELKARHNLLISDKPGMLQERVKALTDEVDKVIKEVKTPAINVNQILAAINASNVTQYISKIGEEIERLRRYVTDDRIPGGIIPGLISKIRPIKWLGSKHDVLLEYLNQAQLQVVNNAKHLQEVLKL